MPVNISPSTYQRAPAGYYLCEFRGVRQQDVLDPRGEAVEKSIWEFVGEKFPESDGLIYNLSIWVTNKFGPQSHQKKLIERMAGTSERDSVGALEAKPATVSPTDPRLAALAEENFASWEGKLFILRQHEGINRAGEPTAWCDADSIWRAEGEPALLPNLEDTPAAAQQALGQHPSGRKPSPSVVAAVEAQAPAAAAAAPGKGAEKPDPFAED